MLRSCARLKQNKVYEEIVHKMDSKLKRKTSSSVRTTVLNRVHMPPQQILIRELSCKIDISADPRFRKS